MSLNFPICRLNDFIQFWVCSVKKIFACDGPNKLRQEFGPRKEVLSLNIVKNLYFMINKDLYIPNKARTNLFNNRPKQYL